MAVICMIWIREIVWLEIRIVQIKLKILTVRPLSSVDESGCCMFMLRCVCHSLPPPEVFGQYKLQVWCLPTSNNKGRWSSGMILA